MQVKISMRKDVYQVKITFSGLKFNSIGRYD